MNKDLKPLVHKIGLEMSLPDKVIEAIVESPMFFMRENIQSYREVEDFKNFRIIGLGIFYTNERIVKEIQDAVNNKNKVQPGGDGLPQGD